MTKNMMKTKFILLYVAVGLICAGTAVAIDVPDANFDNNDVGDGGWDRVSSFEGGWLATGEGAAGSPWIGNNYGGGYPTMGHSAAQWVDVNNNYVYQGLAGQTYEKGASYEFSVWSTTTSASQGLNFLFLDGDTLDLDAPIFDSGVVVIEVEANLSTWSQYVVSYTATAADDGKTIGIGFFGGGDTYIDTVALIAKGVVEPITPASGAEMVGVDAILEWTSPIAFEALGYDVYFGIDPNSSNRTLVADNEPGNTFDPGDLQYDTTYYWWVDVYEPNTLPDYTSIRHKGLRWSFTTEPEAPVIIWQPATSRVGAGATAVFSIEQTNGVTYNWYKVGVTEPVASGDIDGSTVTLMIEGVDESDEGHYYCEIIGRGSTASENARLVIAKLISHWQFEGDLVDSVGGNDGSAYGAAGASFAGGDNGMIGDALSLNGSDPNGVVIVEHSEQLNDDALTISMWVKVTGGEGSWRSPLTSRSETEDPASQFGYNLYVSTGNTWQFWTGNPAGGWESVGSTAAVEGEWVFVTATYDASMLEKRLYINGQPAGNATLSAPFNVNPSPNVLKIGAGGGGDPLPNYIFNGLIDDVKIWNYALNPYAVAKLYTDVAGGTVCVDSELLLYDFDGSCRIDIGDVAVFAMQWLACNYAPDCLDEHTYKLD